MDSFDRVIDERGIAELVGIVLDESRKYTERRNALLDLCFHEVDLPLEVIRKVGQESRFKFDTSMLLRSSSDKGKQEYAKALLADRKCSYVLNDVIRALDWKQLSERDVEVLVEIYDESKSVDVRNGVLAALTVCSVNGLADFFVRAYRRERLPYMKLDALIGLWNGGSVEIASELLVEFADKYKTKKSLSEGTVADLRACVEDLKKVARMYPESAYEYAYKTLNSIDALTEDEYDRSIAMDVPLDALFADFESATTIQKKCDILFAVEERIDGGNDEEIVAFLEAVIFDDSQERAVREAASTTMSFVERIPLDTIKRIYFDAGEACIIGSLPECVDEDRHPFAIDILKGKQDVGTMCSAVETLISSRITPEETKLLIEVYDSSKSPDLRGCVIVKLAESPIPSATDFYFAAFKREREPRMKFLAIQGAYRAGEIEAADALLQEYIDRVTKKKKLGEGTLEDLGFSVVTLDSLMHETPTKGFKYAHEKLKSWDILQPYIYDYDDFDEDDLGE